MTYLVADTQQIEESFNSRVASTSGQQRGDTHLLVSPRKGGCLEYKQRTTKDSCEYQDLVSATNGGTHQPGSEYQGFLSGCIDDGYV